MRNVLVVMVLLALAAPVGAAENLLKIEYRGRDRIVSRQDDGSVKVFRLVTATYCWNKTIKKYHFKQSGSTPCLPHEKKMEFDYVEEVSAEIPINFLMRTDQLVPRSEEKQIEPTPLRP